MFCGCSHGTDPSVVYGLSFYRGKGNRSVEVLQEFQHYEYVELSSLQDASMALCLGRGIYLVHQPFTGLLCGQAITWVCHQLFLMASNAIQVGGGGSSSSPTRSTHCFP